MLSADGDAAAAGGTAAVLSAVESSHKEQLHSDCTQGAAATSRRGLQTSLCEGICKQLLLVRAERRCVCGGTRRSRRGGGAGEPD